MPFRPPRLQAELERMAQERLVAEREAGRIYRREVFRVSLECIGCCCLGLLSMGFALHTTDRDIGAIAWWAGLVIGYAGITLSLAMGYLRGVERGDW